MTKVEETIKKVEELAKEQKHPYVYKAVYYQLLWEQSMKDIESLKNQINH